jgi:hypothetical protein
MNTPPTSTRKIIPTKPHKYEQAYTAKRNALLDTIKNIFDDYKDIDENHLQRNYSSICHLKCSKQVEGRRRVYFVKDGSYDELMINQHLNRIYPDGFVGNTCRFPQLQEATRISDTRYLLCFEWIDIDDRRFWTPIDRQEDMQNVVKMFYRMTGVKHLDDMGGNYYWDKSNKTFLMLDFGDAVLDTE